MRVKIDIPPLVSEEEFDRVQEILNDQARAWKNSRSDTSRFENSGLLFCGCDHRMYAKSGGSRTGRRDFYWCSSAHRGGPGCGSPKPERVAMDFTVTSFVSEYFTEPKVLQSILDSVNLQSNRVPLLTKIEESQREIAKLKSEKKRLLHLAVRGLFSDDELEGEAQRIQSEVRTWESIAKNAEKELEARCIRDTKQLAHSICSVFSEFEFLQRSDRRKLLRTFISRIEVSDRSITKVRLRLPDSRAKFGSHPAPDLVERNFSVSYPNHLWVGDITYVPTWAGFVYLAVVVDAFSRRVVGWSLGNDLKTRLVTDALQMALQARESDGVIHHSDQGTQYTSIEFELRCKRAGVRPSMGSAGDCYDNALCESFFATLECELIDRHSFRSKLEARLAVFDYIEGFYNPHRRHSSLDYLSPINYESRHSDVA